MLLSTCSIMSNSATPWSAAHQASLSFIISWSLLKLMSIELVMPPNHLILCHPLLLLPLIFPHVRVSSSESVVCIRWPKDWVSSISRGNDSQKVGGKTCTRARARTRACVCVFRYKCGSTFSTKFRLVKAMVFPVVITNVRVGV